MAGRPAAASGKVGCNSRPLNHRQDAYRRGGRAGDGTGTGDHALQLADVALLHPRKTLSGEALLSIKPSTYPTAYPGASILWQPRARTSAVDGCCRSRTSVGAVDGSEGLRDRATPADRDGFTAVIKGQFTDHWRKIE